jgi:hypothetical protein
VFVGLENVNPDNLAAVKKRQNRITEYRRMLLAWKAQGIVTGRASSVSKSLSGAPLDDLQLAEFRSHREVVCVLRRDEKIIEIFFGLRRRAETLHMG